MIVQVELISDIICPWCYIAKTRLEKVGAILKEEGIDLEIRVAPYQLYPHIPVGGLPKSDFAKFTKPGMGKSLRATAKEEGITIDYSQIERIPNSLEAHRLLWLVKDAETQYNLAKSLFQFYFEQGGNVEDKNQLQAKAKAVGVEQSIIDQFRTTSAGQEEVAQAIQAVKEEGIRAVPVFILNQKYPIIGIQDIETLTRYFRRAAKKG